MFEPRTLTNSIFVIFGATGDLTHRKILPALCKLGTKSELPKNFIIVAVARRDKKHEDYRKDVLASLNEFTDVQPKQAKEFVSKIYYFRNDFDTEDRYDELKDYLEELDNTHKIQGNRFFYLATLPQHFDPLVFNIKKHKFLDRKHKKIYRLIIEKPFGDDLRSARQLNKIISKVFKENEIYRIDHYLGKETVQNLFALRFANRIFKPLWKSEHIENIQITVSESIGVGRRGGYYDKYGALKDMVQNHILQILSLIAMEKPKSFTTKEIKNEKVKVLKKIKKMNKKYLEKNLIFGQYAKGNKKAYVDEEKVDIESKTETYVALKLLVNTKRWKNTPFYIRTGKNMKEKASEIIIYFKDTKVNIFNENIKQNVLVIRLQPDESINLRFNAKKPGSKFEVQRVSMDFCHGCLFDINTPEAYEKLLHNALLLDNTLFTRWDEVECSWKTIDKVSKYMEKNKEKLVYYDSGTWGPDESDILLGSQGHHWRLRNGK